MKSAIASYWQVFRMILVLFSLYLMGDAFSRWDGFRYYASFSEFIPSVALITILWSLVAALTALLVWLGGRTIEFAFGRIGWKIRMEHLLLFLCIVIVLSAAVWGGKRFVWYRMTTTLQVKLIALTAVLSVSILLTGLFRDKMAVVQERITPLVWLFGIWFLVSVPVVASYVVGGQGDRPVFQNAGVSPEDGKGRPNIILVTFDSLTARDMSVYGYHRPTTPFITEWAKRATIFKTMQADSNFTSPTTATLMTGKRSWTHQTYQIEGSKPARHNENFPRLLKNNGYFNMAFVMNPYASLEKLAVSSSFEIGEPPIAFYTASNRLYEVIRVVLYRYFGDKIRLHDWIVKEDFIFFRVVHAISRDFSVTEVPPENAFNSFLGVIDKNPPKPFFAWIHLMPPHRPYLPPEPYMGMFDPSSQLSTFKSQRRAPFYDFEPEEQPIVDMLRARYDEFIRFCDKQFEEFITELAKRGVLENSVIILSADHGESFEHNYVEHSGHPLYEQLTHIPLIIKEPKQSGGRVINDLTGQVDMAPTILDLAGIPAPSWMEGRSLVPLLRGETLPPVPLFSMNFQRNPSRSHVITRGTIAVWEGNYKLIHYLEEDRSMLFNLKHDPDELDNLFNKETETGQRLLSLLKDNLKRANKRMMRGE